MEHNEGADGWTVGPPPNRVRRGGAVIALLALVAGFVGGVGAGFVLDDGGGDEGLLAAVGGPDDAGATGAGGFGDAVGSESVTATTSVAIDSSAPFPGGPTERTRVFRRDTAAGLSVRVFSTDMGADGSPACDEAEWCPPPECYPTEYIETTVVGEWEISQSGGAWYSLADGTDARILGIVTTNWPGQDEPVFGAVVRTSDAVQAVRIRADGHVDEMAPIDGLAVVVVPVQGFASTAVPTLRSDVVVEIVVNGTVDELPMTFDYQPDPACIPPPPPPPTLPPAGEQPADVAATDAAVRERFASVFGSDDPGALESGVDDAAGLSEIRDRLREQYPSQSEPGGVSYEVAELVFTSPDAAVYQFRPIVLGRPLPWQLGNARLIDGDWKITRGTVCAMYRLGGPSC